eukprot:m.36021 g.36021  ORF g.36021 m.36021 type:complete len:682 (+) comp15889_c0_seq1:605-2650(+)
MCRDAIYNIGRAAMLVHAFASNNLDELYEATKDRMHQPIRGSAKVMPALFPIISAALDAGAKGAFLSGAGSSIMALTAGQRGERFAQCRSERKDSEVACAMKAAAEACQVSGRVFVTNPTSVGAHVVSVTELKAGPMLSANSMRYLSTRDSSGTPVTFETAVMQGLAPDGGLYVPKEVPSLSLEQISEWKNLRFYELATKIMTMYIDVEEIPTSTLSALLEKSYTAFSSSHVTPLVEFSDDGKLYLLEQFHGPTCAFKDVALQYVGNLFEFFLERRNAGLTPAQQQSITVLGATSGDTGSAAIQGLRGKRNIEVVILHPEGRVAPIQKAQMTTVLDDNVHNVAMEGTFDDCQTIVKSLFNDPEFRKENRLAAINSINWARILAQIVYYFYAYYQWVGASSQRSIGDKVTFVVPTGNFGNTLAGFYAKRMGLPIEKLVVATNTNDILHRFFANNDYSARAVVPSLAPAMDIVIPSNFERYLYHLLDEDAEKVKEIMVKIKAEGVMELPEKYRSEIESTFLSGRGSDEDLKAVIQEFEESRSYSLCPHTAAGIHALKQIQSKLPNSSFICLATAHPAKFGTVLEDRQRGAKEMEPPVPSQLLGLLNKEQRCAFAPHSKEFIAQLVSKVVDNRNVERARQARASAATIKANSESFDHPSFYTLLLGVGVGVVATLLVNKLIAKV